MKNIIVMFLSIVLIGTNNPINAQTKNVDEFTVQVDGLGCPFCAYGLEKKFKELKGIKKVTIEMETGVMDFVYPADKALSIEQVEKQVEKAGYTPVSVSINRADGTVETTVTESAVVSEEAELTTIEFYVAGNCGMCKARIENTAKKIEGVHEAIWDKETKQLTVTMVAEVLQSDVEEAIAKSGHDTKTATAEQEVYDDLPGCCQYERVEK